MDICPESKSIFADSPGFMLRSPGVLPDLGSLLKNTFKVPFDLVFVAIRTPVLFSSQSISSLLQEVELRSSIAIEIVVKNCFNNLGFILNEVFIIRFVLWLNFIPVLCDLLDF